METSILNSTKKLLGLDLDYTVFDLDVITHINAVFSTLTQLGVGPVGGFQIEDASSSWDSYMRGDPKMNPVKPYMYLRVRLLFDIPTTSFAIAAMEKQIKELEWRLNVDLDKQFVKEDSIPEDGYLIYEDPYLWQISDDEDFPPEALSGDLGYDPNSGNLWRKR